MTNSKHVITYKERVKCPQCDGEGHIPSRSLSSSSEIVQNPCHRCKGHKTIIKNPVFPGVLEDMRQAMVILGVNEDDIAFSWDASVDEVNAVLRGKATVNLSAEGTSVFSRSMSLLGLTEADMIRIKGVGH